MVNMRESIVPSVRLNRTERHEAFWQGKKRKFFLIVSILGVLLQFLFMGNMSYLYGSIWKSAERYHNFNVLYVDYDEGIIGQSVGQAYDQLKGPAFPSLVQKDKSQYPSPNDIVNAVKETTYWAAFMTSSGASERLTSALQGGAAAQDYDPSTVLTYVWNEVRYPPFSDEVFEANFELLAIATRLAYNHLNGSSALASMDQKDAVAVQVLLNPISVSAINIMPTVQGTKLFYNTVTMVMPILQQFFFILIVNGISQQFQLYSKLPVHISGLVRLGLSIIFDFFAGLCTTGYIWGFRESWDVNGNQFVLTWIVLWLLCHIHYLIIDSCTAFLPLPALPFFLLTWIILNITSSVSPFETNPGFYKWAYALPTNEAYTVLTDIWSSGSVPQLSRAIPILFSWWVGGVSVATYAHFYRCHKAWHQDEKLDRLKIAFPDTKKTVIGDNTRPQIDSTPSEALLEAVRVYRSAYGPSAAPEGLWRSFEMATQPDIAHPRAMSEQQLESLAEKPTTASGSQHSGNANTLQVGEDVDVAEDA